MSLYHEGAAASAAPQSAQDRAPADRAEVVEFSVYDIVCPSCGSGQGEPCFMRRAPFEACAWPHRERTQATRKLLAEVKLHVG